MTNSELTTHIKMRLARCRFLIYSGKSARERAVALTRLQTYGEILRFINITERTKPNAVRPLHTPPDRPAK